MSQIWPVAVDCALVISASTISSAKEVMSSSLFVCLSVCLPVSNSAQKLPTDLHEICREG